MKPSLIRSLLWTVFALSAITSLVSAKQILIDASKDDGPWWYPQGGIYDPSQEHQGKALADYLRGLGYQVDELGRGLTITDNLLAQYDIVIKAGGFTYSLGEMQVYDNYLNRPANLILLSEYLWPGQKDELADHLGIPLVGIARGIVSTFAIDPITKDVLPLGYGTGSAIVDTFANPGIQFLGWLRESDYVDLNLNEQQDVGEPGGPPVMGVLNLQPGKVFFIGNVNCMEQVPQPLTDNLITWALAAPTDANEQPFSSLPTRVALRQNYPNPFNPVTTIEYSIDARAPLRIEVLNINGQSVRVLLDGVKAAGNYRLTWDGTDRNGFPVSTGIYLYRIQAGDYVQTQKMLLMK